MQLDVNSELYPMHPKEKYRMVLSETLNLDGTAVTSHSEVLFPSSSFYSMCFCSDHGLREENSNFHFVGHNFLSGC